ncbi:plasmid mobilization protein [Streptomyces capparidis]
MKQINVRVDEEAYAGIEARAEAAGLSVAEYARQVLTDEANDLRHRFLAAGAHFTDTFAEAFAEQFGPAPGAARPGSGPRGRAA